jgi:hypothetical protein
MADKNFGAKKIELIGSSGVPNITSPTNLNLNANTVAISTDVTIGGKIQSDVIVGTGYSVGIGSTQPTESLDVLENLAVKGSVRLVGVNTSLAGTAGTTGDIKMFHGAPFIHDGTAWREFYLKEGVPVTESADTEWDNVVYRNTFDEGFTDLKFNAATDASSSADTVAAPRKFGEKALRLQDGYIRYPHRSEYVFESDWTIEGWMYFDTMPVGGGSAGFGDALVSKYDSAVSSRVWALQADLQNSGYTDFNWYNYDKHGNSYGGTGIGSVANSTLRYNWNHFALVRESSNGSIHFYFNGEESDFTSSNQVIDNNINDYSGAELYFGRTRYQNDWDGLFDDIRISTVARYISTEGSFTPPTEPYPTTGTLSGPVDPPYFGSVLEEVIADTEISSLSNVSSTTPSSGQVLKWNGTQWAPATDLVGVGTIGIELADLSVSTNAVGTNALSYDNTTGTFTFTPTSLVGYATEGYVDNAVLGIVTTGQISGFITAGASGAGFTALTGAAAGTYGDFDKSARITVDSNGRITGITEVGITTDGAGIDVTGISTFNDNVSFASTILVDGAVNLAVNNATITGTAGSTGDIKMIGGAPFFYDGSSWREFALATGTPVTVSEDTEWDNVIFRNTFDSSYTEVSQYANSQDSFANQSLVTSPVKYGDKALRLSSGYLRYPHISAYSFEGEWTIEGWVYIDSLPPGIGGNAEALVSKYNGSVSTQVWAILAERINTGYTDLRWYNHDKHNNSYSGVGIASVSNSDIYQTWCHFAVVREPDNGSIHCYINGIESEFTTNDQVIDNNINDYSGAELYFGRSYYQGTDFDGLFDDIRISNVARYTSVGISTTTTFTPPTQAYATSGTLTVATDPPGDKYGEIGLGTSPTWTGTSGVTVTQQDQGEYRLTFTSSYTNADDYFVLTQPMDQGFAAYVGAARSTTHVDFTINRQSNNAGVDTGSLAVQVTNHP